MCEYMCRFDTSVPESDRIRGSSENVTAVRTSDESVCSRAHCDGGNSVLARCSSSPTSAVALFASRRYSFPLSVFACAVMRLLSSSSPSRRLASLKAMRRAVWKFSSMSWRLLNSTPSGLSSSKADRALKIESEDFGSCRWKMLKSVSKTIPLSSTSGSLSASTKLLRPTLSSHRQTRPVHERRNLSHTRREAFQRALRRSAFGSYVSVIGSSASLMSAFRTYLRVCSSLRMNVIALIRVSCRPSEKGRMLIIALKIAAIPLHSATIHVFFNASSVMVWIATRQRGSS
mmetsp:Transcript_8011/g.33724  ORF Transcript_8011/g.33724 Transcript_8011/m.33724 type:complete len:288 (-) Transcript_8011:577-1440(-)